MKKTKRCQRCGKPGNNLCDNCLVKVLEQRMARELRGHPIKNGSLIAARGLSRAVLVRLFSHKGNFKPRLVSGNGDVKVTSETIDDELHSFLSNWCGVGFRCKKKRNSHIRLFSGITDDELAKYSKHIKSRFKRTHGLFKPGLDALEERYPGTKHSFIKAVRYLSVR